MSQLVMNAADGEPIRLGDILIHDKDGDRGVVVEIGSKEGTVCKYCTFVGDIAIKTGPGSYRCTNNYSKWRHIERRDQLPIERLLSFRSRQFLPDIDTDLSDDEQYAVAGISSLLPPDPCEDYDDWFPPNSIDEALSRLGQHLQELHDIKIRKDR